MPTAGFLKQLEGFCEAQVISAAKLACHGSSPTYSVSQKRSTNRCTSGSRRLRLLQQCGCFLLLFVVGSGIANFVAGSLNLIPVFYFS